MLGDCSEHLVSLQHHSCLDAGGSNGVYPTQHSSLIPAAIHGKACHRLPCHLPAAQALAPAPGVYSQQATGCASAAQPNTQGGAGQGKERVASRFWHAQLDNRSVPQVAYLFKTRICSQVLEGKATPAVQLCCLSCKERGDSALVKDCLLCVHSWLILTKMATLIWRTCSMPCHAVRQRTRCSKAQVHPLQPLTQQ